MVLCKFCHRTASQGLIWYRPITCYRHREPNYIYVQGKRCEMETKNGRCLNRAYHAVKPGGKRQFCTEHKEPTYINVDASKLYKCDEGCGKQAWYGFIWNKPLYCAPHGKKYGCKPVKGTCCTFCKEKRATWGPKGGKRTACSICALGKGFVSMVKRKMCIYVYPETTHTCQVRASYAKIGGKLEFCGTHVPKGENYRIKYKKYCETKNCPTLASFGIPDTNVVLYCEKHCDRAIHINLIVSMCKINGCTRKKYYAEPGSNKPLTCLRHKKPHYVPLWVTYCKEPGCERRPSYGDRKEGIRKWCDKHKGKTDIYLKACKFLDCTIQRTFGYPGYNTERCATHKTDRMVTEPYRKQKEEDKKCEDCENIIHYNEDFCSNCKKRVVVLDTKRRKRKEEEIKNLLAENKVDFIFNKMIGNCRKVPDFLIRTKERYIVLEVDEHQHSKSNYLCEEKRMCLIYNDIVQKYGQKNVLFIRFNPDKYKPFGENEKIKLEQRKEKLLTVLRHAKEGKLQYKNIEGLNVLYLFYDNYVPFQRVEKIDYEDYV